ncbi:MAG: hypothetical protein LBM96_02300 [Methanobrevibacter sp.]|jgi:hypothetical protein|nr:hypothetical protein [Candidatus Methanoflexus mossambicus]
MNKLSDEIINSYFKNQFKKTLEIIVFSYNQILNNDKKVDKNQTNKHLENTLTNILVKEIRTNKAKFGLSLFSFEVEPGEIDDAYHNKGFIDIKVGNITSKFNNENNEDIYFAFECKRLDLSNKPRLYVKEGIERFKAEKYSKNMSIAGMIGYCELNQSNIPKIVDKINNYLDENEQLILSNFMDFDFCYQSIHNRLNLSKIHLHHLIFDYSQIIN